MEGELCGVTDEDKEIPDLVKALGGSGRILTTLGRRLDTKQDVGIEDIRRVFETPVDRLAEFISQKKTDGPGTIGFSEAHGDL